MPDAHEFYTVQAKGADRLPVVVFQPHGKSQRHARSASFVGQECPTHTATLESCSRCVSPSRVVLELKPWKSIWLTGPTNCSGIITRSRTRGMIRAAKSLPCEGSSPLCWG